MNISDLSFLIFLGLLILSIPFLMFYQDNDSYKFCLDNGFKKGYRMNYLTLSNFREHKCFNYCFSSSEGTHQCDITYFKEVKG